MNSVELFEDIEKIVNTILINKDYCKCDDIECFECCFYYTRNIDRILEYIYIASDKDYNYNTLLMVEYMTEHPQLTKKYYHSFFLRLIIRLFDDFNDYLLTINQINGKIDKNDIVYNKFNYIFNKLCVKSMNFGLSF
jgi:hypothetical protein